MGTKKIVEKEIKEQVDITLAFGCQIHKRSRFDYSKSQHVYKCEAGNTKCDPKNCKEFLVNIKTHKSIKCPVCREMVGHGHYNTFGNHFEEKHKELLYTRVEPWWNGSEFRDVPESQKEVFGYFPIDDE